MVKTKKQNKSIEKKLTKIQKELGAELHVYVICSEDGDVRIRDVKPKYPDDCEDSETEMEVDNDVMNMKRKSIDPNNKGTFNYVG